MQMMSKKLLIILIVVLIIVVAAAVVLVLKFMELKNPEAPSDYAAVYLQSGEIYFGKLRLFPLPTLKNVWYLQRGVNAQNEVQLGILPFKNALWGPIDKIYLNPKNIIWWTYLRNDSELAKNLSNPDLLKQLTQPNKNQQNQSPNQPPLQNNLEGLQATTTKQ
jgi:hypothetical protein